MLFVKPIILERDYPMINITHVITGQKIGGAEMVLLRLLSQMDPKRFSNTVISLSGPGALGPKIRAKGIPFFELGLTSWSTVPRTFFSLLKALKQSCPAVLQTWLYHADLFGLLSGKLMHIPVIWNIRNSEVKRDRLSTSYFFMLKLLALLSGEPQAVIVNSSAGKVAHEEIGYHPKRWALIPNGFDLDLFRPSSDAKQDVRSDLGLPLNTFLVGMVARYDPLKDHRNFIKAASILSREYPHVNYLLVGRGMTWNNEELAQQIRIYGIEKKVHLMGERDDIPRITAAFDIATSSSCSEGFPNVVGEAMCCKVPCVATDVGDSSSILGDAGFIVPPHNPEALAEAWKILICEPDKLIVLGERGRKRIEENYCLLPIVNKYENIYEEIANKK